MADTIQLRRGAAAKLPRLADGEPGWCRDTKQLFIGTPTGNEKIADVELIATIQQNSETITEHEQTITEHEQTITEHEQAITELEDKLDDKLSAKAAEAQAELEAEAELSAVVESFNALLLALKFSGIMES